MSDFFTMISPVRWNTSNQINTAGTSGNYGINFTLKVRNSAFSSTDSGILEAYFPFS